MSYRIIGYNSGKLKGNKQNLSNVRELRKNTVLKKNI